MLFLHVLGEGLQLRIPETVVMRDPIIHLSKGARIQAVSPVTPGPLLAHETRLTQDAKVLRNTGLRYAEGIGDFGDGSLAGNEEIEDVPPSGVGDGMEYIRGGLMSNHGGILYK